MKSYNEHYELHKSPTSVNYFIFDRLHINPVQTFAFLICV